VADLIKNRDRAQAMGAQGRRRVEKEFRQEQMISRLEALYDQVATSKKGGDCSICVREAIDIPAQ